MEQARRPKLRDLPREERYEMYFKIEYQHALDDFIRVLGMEEHYKVRVRQIYRWECVYMNFLSRILKEHTGIYNHPSLSVLKEQIEGCGLECELACEDLYYTPQVGMKYDCVKFTVGGMRFTLVNDWLWSMHSLSIAKTMQQIDGALLRMPASVLIECIRDSIPFIPRIKELAEDAERQAPAVAMVRRIRRMTKKNASVQDSSDTKV